MTEEDRKEYNKKYYQDNIEAIKKKKKEYQEQHKKERLEYQEQHKEELDNSSWTIEGAIDNFLKR